MTSDCTDSFNPCQRGQSDTGEKRFYVLDEGSLASTRQTHNFVTRLHPNDRVLLVGDTRQHEAGGGQIVRAALGRAIPVGQQRTRVHVMISESRGSVEGRGFGIGR